MARHGPGSRQLAQLPARQEGQAGQSAQPQRAAHVRGQPVQPLKAEPGRMKQKVCRRGHAGQHEGLGCQTDWGRLYSLPVSPAQAGVSRG